MNPIIRLLCALIMTISFHVMAMDVIMKKHGCYECSREQFPINKNRTAHILTFYPNEVEEEVAYLDYEIDMATKNASIRMFVCDETDEALKSYFFLVLEQLMRDEHKVNNISIFIRGDETEFYKRFGATNSTLSGDLYMTLVCDDRASRNLYDYYDKKTQ